METTKHPPQTTPKLDWTAFHAMFWLITRDAKAMDILINETKPISDMDRACIDFGEHTLMGVQQAHELLNKHILSGKLSIYGKRINDEVHRLLQPTELHGLEINCYRDELHLNHGRTLGITFHGVSFFSKDIKEEWPEIKNKNTNTTTQLSPKIINNERNKILGDNDWISLKTAIACLTFDTWLEYQGKKKWLDDIQIDEAHPDSGTLIGASSIAPYLLAKGNKTRLNNHHKEWPQLFKMRWDLPLKGKELLKEFLKEQKRYVSDNAWDVEQKVYQRKQELRKILTIAAINGGVSARGVSSISGTQEHIPTKFWKELPTIFVSENLVYGHFYSESKRTNIEYNKVLINNKQLKKWIAKNTHNQEQILQSEESKKHNGVQINNEINKPNGPAVEKVISAAFSLFHKDDFPTQTDASTQSLINDKIKLTHPNHPILSHKTIKKGLDYVRATHERNDRKSSSI